MNSIRSDSDPKPAAQLKMKAPVDDSTNSEDKSNDEPVPCALQSPDMFAGMAMLDQASGLMPNKIKVEAGEYEAKIIDDLCEPAEWDALDPDYLSKQHAFLAAAKRHDWASVREALVVDGSLINVTPSGRWSALHQAAHAKALDAVKMLLQHGANPLLRNRDGKTPSEVTTDVQVQAALKAAEPTPVAASGFDFITAPEPAPAKAETRSEQLHSNKEQPQHR